MKPIKIWLALICLGLSVALNIGLLLWRVAPQKCDMPCCKKHAVTAELGHGPTLPPTCTDDCDDRNGNCGIGGCGCVYDQSAIPGHACPRKTSHKLIGQNNHAICSGECDRTPACLANNCSCAISEPMDVSGSCPRMHGMGS